MGSEKPTAAGFRPRRLIAVLGVLTLLVLAALATAAFLGPTRVDILRLIRGEGTDLERFKILQVRLPKAFAALIVGGALSAAGAAFQALLHNPLASPYILGVSAAGSLGAVIALISGFTALVFPSAFAGALLAIAIVLFISRRNGAIDPNTLLLSGVVINAFFSACILFLTLTSPDSRTQHVLHWLVGGLRDVYEPALLAAAGAAVVLLGLVLFFHGRALNLLAAGDETAERLGVHVPRVRLAAFLSASLLTAVAVSLAGPIGFVGLIIPHAVRALAGSDHRVLIPASCLLGGAFLVFADTAATSLWTAPLPVGILTAFLGAPFFIWILRRSGVRESRP